MKTTLNPLVLLVFVFSFSGNTSLKAENEKGEKALANKSLFGASVSIGGISGTNASFQNFVKEQFQITLPSTRLNYSFHLHVFPHEKASLSVGANLRLCEASQNNRSLDWNQTQIFLDFEYAVFENKVFRIAPLVGISYAENTLVYSNNQVLGNQHNVPDLLGSSYQSLQLKQLSHFGLEAGAKVSIQCFRSLRVSLFAKWEQSLSNSPWKIRQQKMDDMPKFNNSGLNYGLMIGF